MDKFLVVPDLHLCSKRPGRRLDETFFESQLKKFDEIVSWGTEQQVHFIIFEGDFFDAPSLPDFSLLNLILPKLRKLRRNKIECYVVLGSHDMFGYNLSSVDKTAVGSLIHAGLLKVLHGLTEIGGLKFYGIPATLSHNVEVYKNIPPKAIVVTHNTLTPEEVIFEHVLLDELGFCQNFFLCGHYHKPFYEKRGKNVFLNLGPIVRTEKTENDLVPRTALIEVNNGKFKISYCELTHEKDVFDLTERPDTVYSFVHVLQTTKFDFCDLFDLTRKIGVANLVPENIINEAVRRLTNAQRVLQY